MLKVTAKTLPFTLHQTSQKIFFFFNEINAAVDGSLMKLYVVKKYFNSQ